MISFMMKEVAETGEGVLELFMLGKFQLLIYRIRKDPIQTILRQMKTVQNLQIQKVLHNNSFLFHFLFHI